MRHPQMFAAVLALMLLPSSGIGQTSENQDVKPLDSQMLAARRAYIADATSQNAPAPGAVTQYPMRRPPMTPPPGYPARYAPGWGAEPSPRHAIIGAAIGFAIGAIAGSRSSAGNAMGIGAICAGLGAGIGLTVPEFPHRYRHDYDDYDEEANAVRKPSLRRDSRTTLAKARSRRPSEIRVAEENPN